MVAYRFVFRINRNYNTFSILRGFEQFYSSIGWRVMAFSQSGLVDLLRDLMFYPIFVF